MYTVLIYIIYYRLEMLISFYVKRQKAGKLKQIIIEFTENVRNWRDFRHVTRVNPSVHCHGCAQLVISLSTTCHLNTGDRTNKFGDIIQCLFTPLLCSVLVCNENGFKSTWQTCSQFQGTKGWVSVTLGGWRNRELSELLVPSSEFTQENRTLNYHLNQGYLYSTK